MARRKSAASEAFAEIALLVREGEWTTYGDVSRVYRGDGLAARAVGRAAATMPGFRNAHRLLYGGGRIPPDWRASDGKGSEECRQRLVREGVAFTRNGNAHQAHYVSAEELVARYRSRLA